MRHVRRQKPLHHIFQTQGRSELGIKRPQNAVPGDQFPNVDTLQPNAREKNVQV
jgi:hypothetical protein